MALKHLGYVDLPAHRGAGGFDHADIHAPSDRLYVAHTGNAAVDIIDLSRDMYVEFVTGLTAVAGALVSEERGLAFTSNRGENTVSMFAPGAEREAIKIAVGVKPNGLAFDASRGLLIAANVGDPSLAGSHTVSVVDVARRERIAENAVPGRTRWTIYDRKLDCFFVNIASPQKIVRIDAGNPVRLSTEYDIPADGPHGLDLDPSSGRLLCACDAGVLVAIDARSGRICGDVPLSSAPDVVFLHPELRRLYAAVGDPGVIDVVDVDRMHRLEAVKTEPGAHTFALDKKRRNIYAFLPSSHRAVVFHDPA